MRTFCRFAFALCALVVTAALHAQPAQPALPTEAAMVGAWRGESRTDAGARAVTFVTLGADRRFTGRSEIDGRRVWIFEGRWSLATTTTAPTTARAATLTWRYEKSNPVMPRESRIDIDVVLAWSGERMTLRSQRTGQALAFERVR